MEIGKILNVHLTPKEEDTLDMLFSDRISDCNRDRLRKKPDLARRYEKIESMFLGKMRDPTETEKPLLEITEFFNEKAEDFYLYGLKDGIRIALLLTEIK